MGARVPLRAGPSLNQDEIRRRVAGARAATLATLDGDGRPHLVPITFVLSGDELFTAVDHKPKTTRALKRLANIRHDPRVTVLVHSYDEDWAKLWWCRLRGEARVECAVVPAQVLGVTRRIGSNGSRSASYRLCLYPTQSASWVLSFSHFASHGSKSP